MSQTWTGLLFAHWPVPPASIQSRLPPRLEVETFGGSAWLGVVPFRMVGIRPRGLPAVPVLSETLELNVRTYVTVDGHPGVYFFSLDAAGRLAVRIARRFFHLPYFDATMSCTRQGGQFQYRSHRTHAGAPVADFDSTYAATGPAALSMPGSIEYFLTERYALYTANPAGRLHRGRIEHARWPLQPAKAEFALNTMAVSQGFDLKNQPEHLHFAESLNVKILGLRPC